MTRHQLVDVICYPFATTIDSDPMIIPLVDGPLKVDDFVVGQVLLLAENIYRVVVMTNTGLPLLLCLDTDTAVERL